MKNYPYETNGNDQYYYSDKSNNQEYKNNKPSIYNLLKENFDLKNEVKELTEENTQLKKKNLNFAKDTKKLSLALAKIEELKEIVNQKNKEVKNSEAYIKELQLNDHNEKDKISKLEIQIDQLNEHIILNNNQINHYQEDLLKLQNFMEKAKIYRCKYYNLLSTLEHIKKENSNLKKNIELFAKENHLAAIKIKNLEEIINSSNNISQININEQNEKNEINELAKNLINKGKILQGEIQKLIDKKNMK